MHDDSRTTAADPTRSGMSSRLLDLPHADAERVIEGMWRALAAIYGHRWTSAYDADPACGAARQWAEGLAGATLDGIGRVVAYCRTGRLGRDGWPPTLPEALAVAYGIPSISEVRAELLARDAKRSPFATLVARKLDGWAWRHADARTAERMLAEAYDVAREALIAGEPLPEPVLELPVEPERRPADPDRGREWLARIADELGQAGA